MENAVVKEGPVARRIREAARVHRLALRTEVAYLGWARRLWEFSGRREFAALGATEFAAFLTYLAVERSVAASTRNQALAALQFLYGTVAARRDGDDQSVGSAVARRRPD